MYFRTYSHLSHTVLSCKVSSECEHYVIISKQDSKLYVTVRRSEDSGTSVAIRNVLKGGADDIDRYRDACSNQTARYRISSDQM